MKSVHLMPLSCLGLWEAVIIIPIAKIEKKKSLINRGLLNNSNEQPMKGKLQFSSKAKIQLFFKNKILHNQDIEHCV